MDHINVILSLIGVLFLAIIGVYCWTFKCSRDVSKELSRVYETVNNHFQDSHIHGDTSYFVPRDLCDAKHGALQNTIAEIKEDVKSVLRKLGT